MPLPTILEFARLTDTGEIVRVLGEIAPNYEAGVIPAKADIKGQFEAYRRYLVRRIIRHQTKSGEPAHEYIEQRFFGSELEPTDKTLGAQFGTIPGGILASIIDSQDPGR